MQLGDSKNTVAANDRIRATRQLLLVNVSTVEIGSFEPLLLLSGVQEECVQHPAVDTTAGHLRFHGPIDGHVWQL